MSILKSIKTDKCPVCGCYDVIREEVKLGTGNKEILQHCNGTRWETRKFLCGMVIKYEPNFSREVFDEMFCSKNPVLIEQKRKRMGLLDQVTKTIQELEDEKIRNVLLDQISTAKYYI